MNYFKHSSLSLTVSKTWMYNKIWIQDHKIVPIHFNENYSPGTYATKKVYLPIFNAFLFTIIIERVINYLVCSSSVLQMSLL